MAEPTCTINGHTLDTTSQSEGGKYFTPDASNSNFILIQCKNHLSHEQYKDLAELKVQVLQYHNLNTYLCRYEPTDLEPLRSLPFVLSASVFHEELVVNEQLRAEFTELTGSYGQPTEDATVTTTATGSASERTEENPEIPEIPTIPVAIVLHPLSDRTPEMIKQQLVEMFQRNLDDITVSDHTIHVNLQGDELNAVARIDEVQTIERVFPQVLLTNAARVDMGIVKMLEVQGSILKSFGGSGETVCVADSGFDKGLQREVIPPLRQMFIGGGALGRVSVESTILPATVRTGTTAAKTEDKIGHGTHVIGCVGSWGVYSDTSAAKVVKGSGPSTKLIAQVRSNDDGTIPVITTEVFDQAYDKGARVHNNSYGPIIRTKNHPSTIYGSPAQVVDKYTTRPVVGGVDSSDMVIVWAAGNDGVSNGKLNPFQTIGGAGLAKNCITVGASESSNPTLMKKVAGASVATQYSYHPRASPGSPDNMAFFSSRGPTLSMAKGRVKPDLVAPGTCILSARSTSAIYEAAKAADGITPAADATGVSGDKDWMYANGTSMSAPLVSGCAAALRAIIKSNRTCVKPSPRATLIKALLVNGATDLGSVKLNPLRNRGATITGAPDSYQGFGRVNMDASVRNITDTVNGGFVEHDGLLQDELWRKQISTTPGEYYTLRATIVWADRPGADLQSVLQLRGTSTVNPPPVGLPAPAPKVLYANTNDDDEGDDENNVQRLVWSGSPKESLWLEVVAVRITALPDMSPYKQPFSIAWMTDYED